MRSTSPAFAQGARDSRPILKLAKASTACSAQAKAYGQCVLTSYQDARKDMCAAEFSQFKECVQAAMKRKW
ncbi:hypothetical protein FS749_012237 [Ceratobasidium sp. UAMH 11750]|nr:hypothetical protein FS749_012237 [Ceratobasidium sp. UAMH 11750]